MVLGRAAVTTCLAQAQALGIECQSLSKYTPPVTRMTLPMPLACLVGGPKWRSPMNPKTRVNGATSPITFV
eukprot:scaffold216106_cov32-Tisochrysis_lutea.AAC.3